VGVYYDPLIAKLVVWGGTREAAIRRMHRALSEYRVVGLKTNIRFNRWVMENQAFKSGNFDTRFIDLEFTPEVLENERKDAELTAAVAAVLWEQKRKSIPQIEMNANPSSNGTQNTWKHAGRVRALR
ncbi:MAG: biotin carboxylase, partial [Calditrichaeota bacterium]|nr:biotin carboxylase [Calditrichota bacterium]